MKRILTVVTIILIASAATLISQPQLDKANDLLKQNKAGEAITICQSYIKAKPRDENGWLILAKACLQIGMLDSAENSAKKVVALDDEMLEGYAILGQVQIAKKSYQEAGETARAGLKTIKPKLPKSAPLLVVLGQSLLATGSPCEALVAAAKAKEIDPKNTEAYEVIGDAYAAQNVNPMAIDSYEKSLEVDSAQSRVLYKLANTYTKERQYTEAARVYSRILALDPNNEAARLELAGLFYRAKQWSRCAAVLKEYVKNHKNVPKDVQSIYMEALFNSRQYKEAFQIAQVFLTIEPNSPLATRIAAYGYADDKQYAKSIELYTVLATLDTLQLDDYKRLGFIYKQTKKDTLAAMMYETALKVDSTQSSSARAILYGEIGSIWMKLKAWERAADNFEKRIQLDSTAVGAYINYAQCMMQIDRFEKSSAALKKAIIINPKYPPAYVNLGFCYYQMKDYDTGRKEFETAITIIDTAESRYRFELADANHMIALAIMLEKKTTPEASQKKWEEAITYLKKSVKFKEDVGQTHLHLGQCYQNLNKKEDAIREYKRALKLEPKNEQAQKGLEMLLPN